MSDPNVCDIPPPDSDDDRRDGLSLETAIVIEAEDSWIGVRLEYDYVSQRHGALKTGWFLESQQLVRHDGHHYDVLRIRLSNGESRTYHFDITDFYRRR